MKKRKNGVKEPHPTPTPIPTPPATDSPRCEPVPTEETGEGRRGKPCPEGYPEAQPTDEPKGRRREPARHGPQEGPGLDNGYSRERCLKHARTARLCRRGWGGDCRLEFGRRAGEEEPGIG